MARPGKAAVQTITFPLEGEFIALNDLLKLAGVCDSGGAGKALVAAGERADRPARRPVRLAPAQQPKG